MYIIQFYAELYPFADADMWYLQVMPGLLLCFVLRYDAYKKAQLLSAEAGVPPPSNLNKIRYV